MNLTVKPRQRRDGGGYDIFFEGGEACLQPGMTADRLDLIWLGIDTPGQRGQGRGQAVVAALAKCFAGKSIKPWSVAPEADGFWLDYSPP